MMKMVKAKIIVTILLIIIQIIIKKNTMNVFTKAPNSQILCVKERINKIYRRA